MNIYKIQLLSGNNKDLPFREWCINNGRFAISYRDNSDKSKNDDHNDREAWLAIVKSDKANPQRTSAIKLMENEEAGIKKDDLLWTLGRNGIYYLGVVEDSPSQCEWFESIEDESLKNKLTKENNIRDRISLVRKCKWTKIKTAAVPGAVINALQGGQGGTLSRIQPSDNKAYMTLVNYSLSLLDKPYKFEYPDFWSLADSADQENVLGLYLQKKGLFVFPKSARQSTAAIEYMLTDVAGKRYVVQCKIKGGLCEKKIKDLSVDFEDCTIYISQETVPSNLPKNVIFVSRGELEEFARSNEKMMPDRVKIILKILEKPRMSAF